MFRLVDVENKYCKHKLLENKRVSKHHTFVSRELSKICRTRKRVNFDNYVEGVIDAIERARRMGTDIYFLLDNPGSNLPLLFDVIAGNVRVCGRTI